MGISVGRLGKKYSISRSTLLYYDSIGILKPSERTESGYRLYDSMDEKRLQEILLFRKAGVPLEEISVLLSSDGFNISALLMKRLSALNQEIESIKEQQDIIIRLLKHTSGFRIRKTLNKDDFSRLVKAADIDENRLHDWHVKFEQHSPEQHYRFLKMLDFTEDEIKSMQQEFKRKGV